MGSQWGMIKSHRSETATFVTNDDSNSKFKPALIDFEQAKSGFFSLLSASVVLISSVAPVVEPANAAPVLTDNATPKSTVYKVPKPVKDGDVSKPIESSIVDNFKKNINKPKNSPKQRS